MTICSIRKFKRKYITHFFIHLNVYYKKTSWKTRILSKKKMAPAGSIIIIIVIVFGYSQRVIDLSYVHQILRTILYTSSGQCNVFISHNNSCFFFFFTLISYILLRILCVFFFMKLSIVFFFKIKLISHSIVI